MHWYNPVKIDDSSYFRQAKKNNCRAKIYYDRGVFCFVVNDIITSQVYYSRKEGYTYNTFEECAKACENQMDIIIANRYMNKLKTLNGGINMYEYCVMFDRIRMLHSRKIKGKVKVVFEDMKNGSKLECIIPGCEVCNNNGFAKEEVERLLRFCDRCTATILNVANQGGIANAEYF